ncbi:MAG: hypothetical protein K8R52_08670 [Bacteroidales bacterium]|nr:hypothetical protein [Bacteroidales bacterium]
MQFRNTKFQFYFGISREGINYLIETFKPLFPDRTLNPRTIRQSGLKELQAAIEKHHPLG